MNGRLSNSALLRQIIPKIKSTIDGPPQEQEVCLIRKIQPVELVASEKVIKPIERPVINPNIEEEKELESKITQDLLDKINRLKELSEFDNIVKGSKLGLTAYQKPSAGIPYKDLSKDLLNLLDKAKLFINKPSMESLCFGQVSYNQLTKKINFYSPTDKEKKTVLGYIDVSKFPSGGTVDRVLNINSHNAIANSTVTQNFTILRDMIPNITVNDETLNIEKE